MLQMVNCVKIRRLTEVEYWRIWKHFDFWVENAVI